MTAALIVIAAIVVVVLIGVAVSRRRTDPVESFQRQIDALSPEARRPTIGRARPADDGTTDDGPTGLGGPAGTAGSGDGDPDDPDEGKPAGRG